MQSGARRFRCFVSRVRLVLSGQGFLGRDTGLVSEPVRLAPRRYRRISSTLGRGFLESHCALRGASLDGAGAGGRSLLLRSTRRRRDLPAQRGEDRRQFRGVVLGVVDRSEAGHIEVAIQRSSPQRLTFASASGGSSLERGSEPSGSVPARPMTCLPQRIRGRASRGVNSIAKPAGSFQQILAGHRPGGSVPLGIAHVRPGGEERGEQRGIVPGELVDRPHPGRWLAELGDGTCGVRVGSSKLTDQRVAPRHEVLEPSAVQAGALHG